MVFFNWATMQMAAKIVYYGPGLCGKTTNLSFIYAKTAPGSRGEMVSLETETDRTLFFDLLPLEVGKVAGFRTRLQLYTVPGQVFYNTTRKLVLKGVDGVVFVADSQRPMADANVESLKNLDENLAELGLSVHTIPLVLQYNKRDLRNILTVDELNATLNPQGEFEAHESIAVDGTGVFETLKAVTKGTLRSLRKRMATQDSAPAPVARPVRVFDPAALSAAAAEGLETAVPAADTEPPPAAQAAAATPPEAGADAPPDAATEMSAEPATARAADLPVPEPVAEDIEDLPAAVDDQPTGPQVLQAEEVAEDVAAAEVEETSVEFDTTRDAPVPPADSDVRHVKVSSSLGILAELETLRKSSTMKTEARQHSAAPSLDLDSLLQGSLNSRQEVKRRVEERVGDSLVRASRCLVTIQLVDGAGVSVREIEPVEVELKRGERVRQLSLTLLVNLQGD